jgi:hypothetical protein
MSTSANVPPSKSGVARKSLTRRAVNAVLPAPMNVIFGEDS